LTVAAVSGHAASQDDPGVQVLITRPAQQKEPSDQQINYDGELTGMTSAAESGSGSDINPVNRSVRQTDMDGYDNVPRSDELLDVGDTELKSDLMPRSEQTERYQDHGGPEMGVSDTRETAASEPGQMTVEPCGLASPQTVVINGDNLSAECSERETATTPRSTLRAVPRYDVQIFKILVRNAANAKCGPCKSRATDRHKRDQYLYERIT